MAISIFERHGSWYEIYDDRGKKQKTVPESIGMMLGWGSQFFIVHKGHGMIFTMSSAGACFFAIYLRLFTEKELWYEMFAAVLGVVITAIITMILLRGQSDNDVERERAAKVFEEKL